MNTDQATFSFGDIIRDQNKEIEYLVTRNNEGLGGLELQVIDYQGNIDRSQNARLFCNEYINNNMHLVCVRILVEDFYEKRQEAMIRQFCKEKNIEADNFLL